MGNLISEFVTADIRMRGADDDDSFLELVLVQKHEETSEAFVKLPEQQKAIIKECLNMEEQEIVEGFTISTQLIDASPANKRRLVVFLKEQLGITDEKDGK